MLGCIFVELSHWSGGVRRFATTHELKTALLFSSHAWTPLSFTLDIESNNKDATLEHYTGACLLLLILLGTKRRYLYHPAQIIPLKHSIHNGWRGLPVTAKHLSLGESLRWEEGVKVGYAGLSFWKRVTVRKEDCCTSSHVCGGAG